MTLPDVIRGNPHIAAHNDERHAINDLQDLTATGALSPSSLDNTYGRLVPSWTASTSYHVGEVIFNPWGWEIRCVTAHTSSSSFSTDVMSDYWRSSRVPSGYDGNNVGATGDSITANFGAPNSGFGEVDAYLTHASALSQARIRAIFPTSAAGGYTTQQIRDTLLPGLFSTTPRLHAAFVLAGTNNVGGSYSFATDYAALETVYRRMLAMSIKPIACTIPPRVDNANVKGYVDQWNAGVRKLAAIYSLDLVDFHNVLTDQTTGAYKTGLNLNSDGIHPDYAGLKLMGAEAASKLSARFPAHTPYLIQHAGDAQDLLSGSGMYLVDSNSDGLADGLATVGVGSGVTLTRQTDSDGSIFQRITCTSTASTGGVLLQHIVTLPTSGSGIADWKTLEVGDILEVSCRVQSSGFDTTTGTGTTSINHGLSVTFNGTSTTISVYDLHTDLTDGIFVVRGAVPSGMNGTMKVSLALNNAPGSATVWAQWSKVTVRNLTALGL